MSEELPASTTTVKKSPSPVASIIAGSVGGALQVIIGQPFDTIKTRFQIAPAGQFKGPMDVALQTIRKEGPLALYKGMASPLIGISAVNALLFFSYSAARRLVSPFPDPPIYQIAIAGALGGAANTILASPVELFKIRMQGQYGRSHEVKKLGDVARAMSSEFGFKNGVMRGFWITFFREIPAYAGFYGAYEFTKRKLLSSTPHDPNDIPIWIFLTSGAAGGLTYWTCCYPLDVVKSRIQMCDDTLKGISYIPKAFSEIYRKEGLRAFTRGLAPTYLRTIPAGAATFLGYEMTMKFLEKNTNL